MSRPGEPEHPEIPYPFPPRREPPRRTEPVLVPTVGVPEGDPVQRLFERRRILMSGPLDRAGANLLCAQLMALDGESARDVEVVVNSTGGPITEVSAILDVLDLMRAPVAMTCIGTARGTAGILLACGTGRRRAASHASISLRCDTSESLDGTAAEIERGAEELRTIRRRLVEALVTATRQSPESITAELDGGGLHAPAEALHLGIVDEIVGAEPRDRP